MLTNVSVEPSSKKEKHTNSFDGESIYVDLSHKIFLIAQARNIKNNFWLKQSPEISEEILLKHGIFISPEEISSIEKKYSFLIKKSRKYEAILTAMIAMLSFYIADIDPLAGGLLILILLPFIFSFCSEAITSMHLLTINPNKLKPSVETRKSLLKPTAIIIASRNEPFPVAKMTLDSAISLTYPENKKEIIVVDNSDTSFPDYREWKEYVESYSEHGYRKLSGVRVVFIHRDGTEGFKPRNLDMALEAVTSEYILYLDIDSTVQQDTLLRIIPLFNRDGALGFVQLYTSPTNFTGASALALVQGLRNYFLRFITVINAHASHSLFYGHNAIWRTSVVRQMGSCLESHRGEIIVTEDLSMSFRARFNGYYGLGAWVESGEWIPESMRETEAMWLRWTVGTYQVYAKHFTRIKNLKTLNWRECVGWLQHIGILASYGLTPVYVMCGLLLNSALLMWIAVLSLLPEIVQAICAYNKLSLGGMSRTKKILTCYSAFLILGSFINWVRYIGLLRYITRRKQGWKPTGKSPEGEISLLTVIRERGGFLLFGCSCFFYSIFSIADITQGLTNTILVLLCGLYGLNSILSVILFGKSTMREDAELAVVQGDIQTNNGFYLKNN